MSCRKERIERNYAVQELTSIADATGGECYRVEDSAELSEIFDHFKQNPDFEQMRSAVTTYRHIITESTRSMWNKPTGSA